MNTPPLNAKIKDVWLKHPKRGYPTYPTNGIMITRIMIKLEGESVQRRIYDTVVGYDKNRHAIFAPIVMIKGEVFQLTAEQVAQVAYDFKTCRSYK